MVAMIGLVIILAILGAIVCADEGQFQTDELGRYVPDDEGRYQPDSSGQYVPDYSGRYIYDPSGLYKSDGTGGYTPERSTIITTKRTVPPPPPPPPTRPVSTLPPVVYPASREGKWKIIRQVQDLDLDGYHWEYETENGISAEESGKLANPGTDAEAIRAKGFFRYTGPDNVLYSVTYTADENGFLPEGDHLPTPPPLPDALIKAIEFHRAANAKK